MDAPIADSSGGTPPPETGGRADAGDEEIEMPPMYVGRTGLDAAHEEELAQYGTHEELAGLYRSLNENLYERYPDLVEGMNKQLESGEDLDNYEELKAATKGLLDQWYLRDAHHQRLEGRYGDEISVDPGLQTYDQLADYYKNLSMVLRDSGQEPDMTGLDTYEKLRVGTYELWEQRDQYLNQHEGEQHLEEKDESHTNDSHNNAPEIEMPPMYVGRDAGGQEPNDAPDPSGGTPPPEYVEQAGTEDAGDAEIEMYSDGAGRAGDPLEKYVQRLEVRYGKELAHDSGLLLYEVELDGLNSALDYYIRSGQGTWEDHVRLATKIHELEQKRDSYLEKIKDYYDRDAFREEQDDYHRENFDELPVTGSDKDPASESIEDAGEAVGDSYGYGDYFGW